MNSKQFPSNLNYRYREALKKMLEKRQPDVIQPESKQVIDLMDALRLSLEKIKREKPKTA